MTRARRPVCQSSVPPKRRRASGRVFRAPVPAVPSPAAAITPSVIVSHNKSAIPTPPPPPPPPSSAVCVSDADLASVHDPALSEWAQTVRGKVRHLCMVHMLSCSFCPNASQSQTRCLLFTSDHLVGVQACPTCAPRVEEGLDELVWHILAPIAHRVTFRVLRTSGVLEGGWRWCDAWGQPNLGLATARHQVQVVDVEDRWYVQLTNGTVTKLVPVSDLAEWQTWPESIHRAPRTRAQHALRQSTCVTEGGHDKKFVLAL